MCRTAPNDRWSLDFLADVFEPGRRFRIFAVIDDCTRENLGLVADTSLSGQRVVRELDGLIRLYGEPATIVSDNGTELTSRPICENGGDKLYQRSLIRTHAPICACRGT